jgi:hypothetical protein
MAAPEDISLDALNDIPDPAAYLAARPAPPPVVPSEPAPTRPVRERLGRVALAVAFAWIVLVTWFFGFRSDLHTVEVAAPLALWTLLAGVGLALVLRPRARGLPAGVRALQAVVVVVPLAFLVAAAATAGSEPVPAAMHATCLAVTGGLALAPLALAALVLRRSFLSAPAWRGAAIGVLCGLGATIGIHAHCAVADLFHVLLAHGLSLGAGALLGAVAGALQGRV